MGRLVVLLSTLLSVATSGTCLATVHSGPYWNTTTPRRTSSTSSSSSQLQSSVASSHSSSVSTSRGFADYILHGLGADGLSESTLPTITLISTRISVHTVAPTQAAGRNATSAGAEGVLSTGASIQTVSKNGSATGSGAALSTGTTTLPPNATMTMPPNMAYYHDTTFLTVCPSAKMGCYSSCRALAASCFSENQIWDASYAAFQSSMVSRYNGGTTPNVTITRTATNSAKTFWSYQTSWETSYSVTSDSGIYLPQGKGYATTTITLPNGKVSTSHYFKTDIVTYTMTFSHAVAGGDGEGTAVSTDLADPYYITMTEPSSYSFTKPGPSCSYNSHQSCSFASDCDKCTISGGTVQLIYFPTTRTTSGQAAAHTTSPQPTGLVTAVYKNITMTSPTVYISFDKAYAQNECGTQIGKAYPGAILPMDVADLSSVYGGYGTIYETDPLNPFVSTPSLIAGAFTLADLNWPPPLDAYMNQLKYQMGQEIFSIITWPYNPVLEVPPQIRSMDPVSCAFGLRSTHLTCDRHGNLADLTGKVSMIRRRR